jgi:glycosyltransferase involved in cell wall biosynthesis
MIAKKPLKLSIVIPAYNEEAVLGACLHAIKMQTVAPYEVIVVDNKSDDATSAIAHSFAFVKVIREPIQGIIPAHHRGFAAATGDIIARIDADTVMTKTWVERVLKNFTNDPKTVAITGPGAVFEIAAEGSYPGEFFSKYYFALSRKIFGFQMLWCSNMAVRADVWRTVSPLTCSNENLVHDDVDISIILHSLGHKINYDRYLKVYIHGFRFVSPKKITQYHVKILKTRDYHVKLGTLSRRKYRIATDINI